MNRTKLILGAGTLLAVFLLGFAPQYRAASGLRKELSAAQEELRSLQSKARLAELRDLAGLTYLESNAKNYGVAQQYSTRFFTLAGEVAAETSDESFKVVLSEIAAQRDQITAGLAEGKGAAQPGIETLARRLHEASVK